MVMESKTTSKTSCLKALLLRAWRERWSDLQWGINIKTVLPRGVSGDVYNLADCILQQAVVGAGANQLVLSYLRHSLSAQLVSHAAVLQRLSKYNQLSKVHCVFSLLEFLEGMLPGITVSCGKPEETVLATAVLSVALWLLHILQHCQSDTIIIKKASELLRIILTDDFYISMMCLARYNDPDLFAETNRKCLELETIFKEQDEILPYIRKLANIDVTILHLPIKTETWPGSLIQCWLEVKLTGNPGTSTAILAQQLKIFKKLKGFSNARLYAELMRGSLMSLYNVRKTTHESQWGAFAFLKVPHILLELAGSSDSISIVTALELMLQHSPLLDAMDANSSCSNFECLLDELSKNKLLSEPQVKMFLEKRKTPPSLKMDSGPGNNMPTYWHICAESTLTGILKTLSSDYQKIQDALLKMLHQVLAGNSYELILAVATVQDKLGTLVNRLIKFNECSKSAGEAKSQLFDITFVMLVTIVQNYGAAAVLDSDGESLFEQWVRSCMVERHKPKAADQILRLGDPVIIQSLLEQFNSGESEFKPGVKWQEILFNIPGVMHEVLVAWEQGALVPQDVKRILDAVRGKMCCLPIVAAAWLCAYMRTAPQETLLKPINMVQQLLNLNITATEEDNLNDRWQLTCEIIKKMQRDVQLPLPIKTGHYLVSRQPATEQLGQAWKLGISRGWLDNNSAGALHCLLETAGTRWLVSAVIHELVKLRYRDQLQRGIDLALAMFHVDIVGCTQQLLSHVLPQLLYNDVQADGLMEPQLPALAYVTSYCVYTAWDALSSEDFDTVPPVAKMSRLSDTKEEESKPLEQLIISLRQLLHMFEGVIQEGSITQQTYFAFYLIKSLVEVKVPSASTVLGAIPPSLISDLLKTMPELFSYPLLLHIHDVASTSGRINMAKDLCILRNYHLKNVKDNNNR
ncbi:mediator of RNA polymerase II transcription subunit 24 isoform X1 [Diorhabda sublineata]|uniref:mediator of RNA polymerase II transcription subunit 24 isoform X1 n=1 Tax=Diorhabda sublineata TaxID=1163346 RepID=UPI0024E17652|nr:mediator of RNA polymerase II transcription subunit 24 isoform X1 [Diorhabda sublineata]